MKYTIKKNYNKRAKEVINMSEYKYLKESDCDTSQDARLSAELCYQLKRIADLLERDKRSK